MTATVRPIKRIFKTGILLYYFEAENDLRHGVKVCGAAPRC